MLRTLEELHDDPVGAVDGDIGHVKDLYLDDKAWVGEARRGWRSTPAQLGEARWHEHCGRIGYWAHSERRETEISRI